MSSLWSQESSLEWMKYPPCMESYILMPYSQDRGTGIHHPSFLLLSHSSRSIVQYLLRLGIVKFFLNFRRKEQIFVYTVHLSNACYMLFPFHPPWLVNCNIVYAMVLFRDLKKKWLILLFSMILSTSPYEYFLSSLFYELKFLWTNNAAKWPFCLIWTDKSCQ